MLLDRSLDGRGRGPDDLIDLLAVLEEEEGRHGAHAELRSHVRHGVDVNLVKSHVGVGVAVARHLWRNHLARAAPFGEAVQHHQARVVRAQVRVQGRVEVGLAGVLSALV